MYSSPVNGASLGRGPTYEEEVQAFLDQTSPARIREQTPTRLPPGDYMARAQHESMTNENSPARIRGGQPPSPLPAHSQQDVYGAQHSAASHAGLYAQSPGTRNGYGNGYELGYAASPATGVGHVASPATGGYNAMSPHARFDVLPPADYMEKAFREAMTNENSPARIRPESPLSDSTEKPRVSVPPSPSPPVAPSPLSSSPVSSPPPPAPSARPEEQGSKELYDAQRRVAHGPRWDWTSEKVVAGALVAGKTFVVTGATSGLGKETARVLAAEGGRVIVTARDPEKADELERELGLPAGSALPLDLCSFRSVDTFLDLLEARGVKVDAFINNAGTMFNPFRHTEDGFEMQMQVNYLSVAILVRGLIFRELMAEDGRIVVVSSCGHGFGDCEIADVNWDSEGAYDKMRQYYVTKGLVIMFCNHIARQLQDAGSRITINSVHPGVIMTNLARDLAPEEIMEMGKAQNSIDSNGNLIPVFKTIPEGASTQVWAAVSPELEGRSGCYLENCSITPEDKRMDLTIPFHLSAGVNPYVWNISRQEELIGATAAKLGRKVDL